MSNVLVFSDWHILEKELEECSLVGDELTSLIKKYNVNHVISAGDMFDKVYPTYNEINLFANFIKTINIPISIVVANSHESVSPESSIFNHFPILKDNITICKEYIDENHLFVGHFIFKQSKLAYKGTVDIVDFKQYKYVVVGHQHSFEMVPPNACQLGSVRFVDFAEAQDKAKVILLIENYKTDKEQCHFIGLKSPYPMIDIQYSTLDQIRIQLDSLNPKTKVRLKFSKFEDFKQWLTISKDYEFKFNIFKTKKEFETKINNQIIAKENSDLNLDLELWLKNQNVDEEIKNILKKEIKK